MSFSKRKNRETGGKGWSFEARWRKAINAESSTLPSNSFACCSLKDVKEANR
jgi:hypothetical protein